MTPQELERRILFRDGLAIILDKPAGLPVHGGPGGGQNLEMYLGALRFGLPKPPALAHRLDRDTSGCLVLGRHAKALRRLGTIFAEGMARKLYWAVVIGTPFEPAGILDMPLLKKTHGKTWRVEVDPVGQAAVTEYRVLGENAGLAWLEFRPMTGRTHQIRVHCATAGFPVLGDRLYGPKPVPRGVQLHLHARTIELPLYPTRDPVSAIAPPPPHMLNALRRLGYVDRSDAA